MLDEDDLNDTDEEILDLLVDGNRVTTPLVVNQLDVSREYVIERLKRLTEHGHVTKPVRGLYELEDDPRGKKLTLEDVENTLSRLAEKYESASLHCYDDPDGVIGRWVVDVGDKEPVGGDSIESVLKELIDDD